MSKFSEHATDCAKNISAPMLALNKQFGFPEPTQQEKEELREQLAEIIQAIAIDPALSASTAALAVASDWLRNALHRDGCDCVTAWNADPENERPCDCGLDALRKQLAAIAASNPNHP